MANCVWLTAEGRCKAHPVLHYEALRAGVPYIIIASNARQQIKNRESKIENPHSFVSKFCSFPRSNGLTPRSIHTGIGASIR